MYDIPKLISSFKEEFLLDQKFLEEYLIPCLGLNNENISEQPAELLSFLGHGFGLRIWQYPNQFSKYLILLSNYSKKINNYLEIGSRHGGTFVLTSEYIKALNEKMIEATAVDLISEPPLISDYKNKSKLNINYLNINSQSLDFIDWLNGKFYDLILIDGDHSYEGVKKDAENTRELCNIQVFHDITNDACLGVSEYWNELKNKHSDTYDFHEFTDQYDSVNGTFLGIGVAIRKKWITI